MALTSFIVFSTARSFNQSVKNVWLVDDGNVTIYRTEANNFKEFLESENIPLSANDFVDTNLTEKIKLENINKVNIERSIEVSVNMDQNTKIVNVNKNQTTDNFIKMLELQTGRKYEPVEEYPQNLSNISVLNLVSNTMHEFVTKEIIPYESVKVYSDFLLDGDSEMTTVGVVGEKEIITTANFKGGVEQSRKVKKEKVTVQPISEVITVGTKKPTVKKIHEYNYTKEYTMNASAYTAGYESTGKNPGDPGYGITASGMQVRHGVVAVDPRVIPLGTKLYVDGYGVTIAADTGGAIKGNKIDLYFEDLDDAINFGRRDVKVYVLE
jgi:3D (Asp-Asp-Asp) domain-containing protein